MVFYLLIECSCYLQKNHAASVFLAYAILQIKRKTYRLKNPEEALKRAKHGNVSCLKSWILALDHIFESANT